MKKTTSINIANTQFVLETDGYEALEAYLEKINLMLSNDPDKAEIVRDIEARIAEMFLELNHSVITLEDVRAVITTMGAAEEFAADEATDKGKVNRSASKRLYRDPDDAIVAGVSSGLAAYFRIDPLIVRLIFFVSIFMGGSGIVAYLLLWLIVPTAATPSQKLAMRGDPITVETVREAVKERIDETKDRGTVEKLVRFPFEVIEQVFKFLTKKVFPLINPILGGLLIIGAGSILVGITIALVIGVVNYDASFVDFPLAAVASATTLLVEALFLYLTVGLPLIGILILGARLIRQKKIMKPATWFGLIGLWVLSLIVSTTMAISLLGDFRQYTQTHPDYAPTTQTLSVEEFSTLDVSGWNKKVTVIQTNNPTEQNQIIIEGRPIDTNQLDINVEDGTLTITDKDEKFCVIICDDDSINITVYTASLETVNTHQAARVKLDNIQSESLDINTDYSGLIEGTIDVGSLTIDLGHASTMRLNGRAQNAEITLAAGADMEAPDLVINEATLSIGSHAIAIINVVDNLESDIKDESSTVENKASSINQ